MLEFLEGLGDQARDRPSPTMKGATVAAGAFVSMAGLLAIAADQQDDGTNVIGIVLGAVAVALGHGVLVRLDPSVRPAGIALITLGTAAALTFLLDDLDEPAPLLFLLALAFGIQWAVGPGRGAMPLLTLALLSLWALILDVVAGDPEPNGFGNDPFADDPFGSVPETSFTSSDDTVAYVSLVIGVLLLFGARQLDKGGWHGVATSLVIVGDVAFVTGVFGVVGTFESDAPGGILVIAAGAVMAFIGATGGRRFTTWLGGIGVFIGILVLINTAVELDDLVTFGIAATVVGLGVIAAGAFLDLDTMGNNGNLAGTADAAATTEIPGVSPPPSAPPAPELPAEQGWHPDPTRRHELRWYNGAEWTNNVSDQGAVTEDDGV